MAEPATGLKVLVIGTGFGKYAAAPAYRRAGFDVELLSPRDDDAVRRAIASNVDLVSVHSPPFMHVDHVLQAIDHGHAVLCDKPFGRNTAEAATMRDRAQAAGVLHALNFQFRAKEVWTTTKQLIADGAIGTPTHLSWTYFGNGLRGRQYGWMNDHELGGGWIGAYGAHLIDLARWLFDSEVDDCGGVTRIEDLDHPDSDGTSRAATAEDAYSAWLAMTNGATASHDTGFAGAVPVIPRGVLTGSAGTVEVTGDAKLVLRRPKQDAETYEFARPAKGEPDQALVAHFGRVADALRDGGRVNPSFDDGVAVAEVMDRLRSTAFQRRND